MKIKEVVKTEETIEREISLPFYYRGQDCVGECYVKVVDEKVSLLLRQEPLVQLTETRTSSVFTSYKLVAEITRDEFETAYFDAAFAFKAMATPEYVLSEDEKQDFQHQY
jgi:hypothetical protein